MSYPVGPQFYPPPLPSRSSTAHIVIAWILAVLTVGYMLPWAIAATRNKTNVLAIAMINLFLGWSLVGWVAALVMACMNDAPQQTMVVNTFPVYPAQQYQQPHHYQPPQFPQPQYPQAPYQPPAAYPPELNGPSSYPPALNAPPATPQESNPRAPYGYSDDPYRRPAPPQ